MNTFLPSTLVEWTQFLSFLISGVGILIAGISYANNKKIKRAEWLKSLFEKFYENDLYKEVRKWIDWESIEQELENDKNHEKEEKFADFLNFFEFIAILESKGQIKKEEVETLFIYYMQMINKSEFCRQYIQRWGYKNLQKLLEKIRDEK